MAKTKTKSATRVRGTCSLEKSGKSVKLSCTDGAAARKIIAAASRQPVEDSTIRRLAKHAVATWRKKHKGEKHIALTEAEANKLWIEAQKGIALVLGTRQAGSALEDSRKRFFAELENVLPVGHGRYRIAKDRSMDLFGPAEFEGAVKPGRRFSVSSPSSDEDMRMAEFGGAIKPGKGDKRFRFASTPEEEFGFAEFEGAVKPGARNKRFSVAPTPEEEFGFAEFEGAVKPTRVPSPDDVRDRARARQSRIARPTHGRGSARR